MLVLIKDAGSSLCRSQPLAWALLRLQKPEFCPTLSRFGNRDLGQLCNVWIVVSDTASAG